MTAHSSHESPHEILRSAGNWCRDYLELQHSREVGAAFREVMRTFAEIAAPAADGNCDRFERLKQLEGRLDEQFAALAAALHDSLAARAGSSRAERSQTRSGKTRLFVYGTLKRGGCREFALAGQRFLGTACTLGGYRLYHCGDYPALVHDADGIAIEGELWEVDECCLSKLDEIEGVSMLLYERAPIRLAPPNDGELAESYFYLRSVKGLRDCGPRWPYNGLIP